MPFTDPFVANPFPFAVATSCPLANQLYDVTQSLLAGVYTISWSGGGTVTIDFYNGTTFIGTANGTSSITFNLATSITNYKVWNTVAGTTIVISLSALAIAPATGTLYTYTTSGTPGLIGDAYVVIVGGGAGGSGTPGNVGFNGGGSGGVISFRATLIGNEALVIGTAGVGGIGGTTPATNGGDTTFAGQTALGGLTTGVAVTGGGAGGISGSANATASNASSYLFSIFQQGTTGGGGADGSIGSSPAGSGIGTGGVGRALGGGNGGNAIGFGAGGGVGNNGASPSNGGNGTPGICYIII